MKFKLIFVVFNIAILVFLLLICFMPFFAFGYGGAFHPSVWPLALFLLAVLAFFDVYYGLNYRLFSLLEREDWPALSAYLEEQVLRKGRYSKRLVNLLATTYLVMSDIPAVTALENRIGMAKPALLERGALVFGVARLLGKDYAGAVRFFSPRIGKGGNWPHCYYAFALLLDRKPKEAAEQFQLLAAASANPLISGLAAWFLAEGPGGPYAAAEGEKNRLRVRKSLKKRAAWDAELGKLESEVYAAVLRKYINRAGDWIFGSGSARPVKAPEEGGRGREEL
ncbi:MAG: hypothetical protein LBL70_00430 [Treponema sp.]|nr:hypothetical protein [Treponema sp.]